MKRVLLILPLAAIALQVSAQTTIRRDTAITFMINAIFTGTWGITSALLVMQLFRLKLQINPLIISSIGILLLLGASTYLLKTVLGYLYYYYSDGTYNRYTFKKDDFLFSMAMSGIWLLNYGLLPQLLWIRKLRRLSSLVVLICIWAITSLAVPWGVARQFLDSPTNTFFVSGFKFEFSFTDYVEQGGVYAVAFAMVYSFLSRRNNDGESQLEEQLGAN